MIPLMNRVRLECHIISIKQTIECSLRLLPEEEQADYRKRLSVSDIRVKGDSSITKKED